jgi:Spy/CpxP family protein refolding chaperone
VDAFNADTNRLKVQLEYLIKSMLTPEQKAKMEHELEGKLHDHVYEMVRMANEADLNPPDATSTNGSGQ